MKVNDFLDCFHHTIELFEDKNPSLDLRLGRLLKGEKGVWIERKLNSNEFYFKSTQGSFVNDERIINQITQHSL